MNETSEKSIEVSVAPNIHEVYVTFVLSEDAYNAFLSNRWSFKTAKVLPADTWHQPGVKLIPMDLIPIMNDNHECENIEISVHDILNDRTHFCESMNIKTTVHLKQPANLKSIFEGIRPMKERVQDLTIIFDMESVGVTLNCLSDHEYVSRIIQVLGTCVGENFSQLTICEIKTISMDLLEEFAPLLQNVKSLEIQSESDGSVMYALQKYCPNLNTLKLFALSWNGEFSNLAAQQWPTLFDLNLCIQESDTENIEKLQNFFELNPQLTHLEVRLTADNELCDTIGKLPNLEHLAIVRQTYDDIELILNILSELKKLKSVVFNVLMVEKNGLNAMIKCAEQFKKMKELKTVIIFQNLEPDTIEKEEYRRYFTCPVEIHDDCSCHHGKRVLAFSKKEVKLPKERPVFVTYVNTKKDSDDIALILKFAAASQSTLPYYPNIIDRIIIEDEENMQIVHVNYA